jgi:cysteine desulfurase/selenocysteine lyase
MLGPTGVGILWGKEELLQELPPLFTGGHMVESVSIARTTFKEVPHKFEAGTQHIAGVCALQEAVAYLTNLGMSAIQAHEQKLTSLCMDRLKEEFPHITILGPHDIKERAGIISFSHPSFHPHDIAHILARDTICVRAGHHCAMPLHSSLRISSSTRISFFLYNDESDIEKFIQGLHNVQHILS